MSISEEDHESPTSPKLCGMKRPTSTQDIPTFVRPSAVSNCQLPVPAVPVTSNTTGNPASLQPPLLCYPSTILISLSPTTRTTICVSEMWCEVYLNKVLSYEEAAKIFYALEQRASQIRKECASRAWNEEEISYIQWLVFNYCDQLSKNPFCLTTEDWGKISILTSWRTPSQCKSIWDSTQCLNNKRNEWSEFEDELLRNLVTTMGSDSWTNISRGLASKCGITKTPRQCRDRWLNHLNPSLNMAKEVSHEEILRLCEEWLKIGNKWGKIAARLCRPEYWVKKHWKILVKKEGICTTDKGAMRMQVRGVVEKMKKRAIERTGTGFTSRDTEGSSKRVIPECDLLDINSVDDGEDKREEEKEGMNTGSDALLFISSDSWPEEGRCSAEDHNLEPDWTNKYSEF